MKPILFNTEMVRAILDGRKTVTRRLVKPQPEFRYGETGTPEPMDDGSWQFRIDGYKAAIYDYPIKPTCYAGDILYVRETWAELPYGFVYRANGERPAGWDRDDKWRPSIHMPKEAARIFLRVKNVRVERLRDITEDQAKAEGCIGGYMCEGIELMITAKNHFANVWTGTIKPEDIDTYGWWANPWVWVIEFEQISKEEALNV